MGHMWPHIYYVGILKYIYLFQRDNDEYELDHVICRLQCHQTI
jgi:hypothetical protein